MARLNIEIDDDTNRQLTELAAEYDGDLGLSLAGIPQARDGLEDWTDRSEAEHGDSLRSIRDKAEADFTAKRTVSWNEVKIRNGL